MLIYYAHINNVSVYYDELTNNEHTNNEIITIYILTIITYCEHTNNVNIL